MVRLARPKRSIYTQKIGKRVRMTWWELSRQKNGSKCSSLFSACFLLSSLFPLFAAFTLSIKSLRLSSKMASRLNKVLLIPHNVRGRVTKEEIGQIRGKNNTDLRKIHRHPFSFIKVMMQNRVQLRLKKLTIAL